MRATEGTDFGLHGLLLLGEHAAHLQITDLGEHGTLHERATLVILNVAHPDRFIECNLLGEALLLEVSNGIVIGVGKEVHNWRGGFHVVLIGK